MENKDWEKFLHDLNGGLHSEENKTSADDPSSNAYHIPDSTGTTEDDLLREILNGYSPTARVEGWDKIAASLDAADELFDQKVRQRINQYHPAYDPQSWPKFAKRFSAHKHLRTRLIVLKLSEAAAILLLMLTVLHLGHEGRLPFQEPMAEETGISPLQDQNTSVGEEKKNDIPNHTPKANIEKDPIPGSKSLRRKNINSAKASYSTNPVQPNIVDVAFDDLSQAKSDLHTNPDPTATTSKSETNFHEDGNHYGDGLNEVRMAQANQGDAPTIDFLTHPIATVEYEKQNPIQTPTLVALAGKTYFEFGMLAQADYNQLKMPEDRLNSNGEQIIFPLQGITSPGYGAGITMAIGHPRWAIETGIIYNAKTFKPGRELTIGNEADNSKVEYEAMHMQLISVPLQFRYRFDHKGRLKTYALAGFGLNLIAQSDIDVKVDYNFPSLNEGEDPNANPFLARTIRQTQRVSEDIRERAPFSTNSYISANLGLGIEYTLVERKTLFLQTAYQYQIPNLRFSNHNGKHVLSLSLQAGVRTPLGT